MGSSAAVLTFDRHGVSVILLCLLLAAGCRDAVEEESEESADAQLRVVIPAPARHDARPSEVKGLLSPSYQSAIRMEPLSAEQFPQVIPDNGARHGYATILESLGSGCAAVDFDRDGWPDALIAGGGDFVDKTCVGQPVHVQRN